MAKSIVKAGSNFAPNGFSSFTSALLELTIFTSVLARAMHSRMVFPGTLAAISLGVTGLRRNVLPALSSIHGNRILHKCLI